MPMIQIKYTRNGEVIRNWIDINSIQSITDGDSPSDYRTIISYPDHKMFFDVRTPEQFLRDLRNRKMWS